MGAEVVGCPSGTRTLKDATTEAIRDWVTNVTDTPLHHRIGRRTSTVSTNGT